MAEIRAEIDFGAIKNVVKAMSRKYQVKVGLLANTVGNDKKTKGSDDVSANMDIAGLGMLHEYGADIKITDKMRKYLHLRAKDLGLPPKKGKGDGYLHIPARSWLQMPIQKKNELRKRILENLSSAPEDIEYYIAKTGDLMSLAIIIGSAAVDQILAAFETEGFGEWKENSLLTIAQKNSEMPLVDKGRLKGGVTYEVNENG